MDWVELIQDKSQRVTTELETIPERDNYDDRKRLKWVIKLLWLFQQFPPLATLVWM
jgi:hypothetical protein